MHIQPQLDTGALTRVKCARMRLGREPKIRVRNMLEVEEHPDRESISFIKGKKYIVNYLCDGCYV